jgi:tape measure domain-containing protein
MAQTTSGIIQVKLTADAQNLLRVLGKVNGQIQKIGDEFQFVAMKSNKALTTMSNSLSKTINTVFALKTAMAVFGGGMMFKSILDTSIAFNKWEMSLEAIVGSSGEAKRVQDMLKDSAERLGQRYIILLEQYSKFRAAAEASGMGVSDIDKMFESVTKGATVFQLASKDTYEIFRALTQMISKGTISAEELRGQFGERLPAALAIMANSLGVSLSQLLKMMDNGELLSTIVLPKLADGLEEFFGPRIEKVLLAVQTQINRLINTWELFLNNIGERGVLNSFVNILQTWSNLLKNNNIMETSAQIAASFGKVMEAASSFVAYLLSLPRELYLTIIGFILGAWVGGPIGAVIGGGVGLTGGIASRFTDIRVEIEKTADKIGEVNRELTKLEKIINNVEKLEFKTKYEEDSLNILRGKRDLLKKEYQEAMEVIERYGKLELETAEKPLKQDLYRSKELDLEIQKLGMKYDEEKKILDLLNQKQRLEENIKNLTSATSAQARENLNKEMTILNLQIDKSNKALAEIRQRDLEKEVNERKQINDKIRSIMYSYYQSVGDDVTEAIERENEQHQKTLDELKALYDKKERSYQEYLDLKLIAEQTNINNINKINEEATQKRLKEMEKEAEAVRKLGEEKQKTEKERLKLLQKISDVQRDISKVWMLDYDKSLSDIEEQVREFEEALKALGETYPEIQRQSEKYRESLQKLADQNTLRKFGEFITQNIVDPLYQAIEGAMSFKEAFKNMAQSILRDLSQMALKAAFLQSFGLIFASGGGTGTTTSGFAKILGSVFGFAKGGIAEGGFRSFANGGTTTQPTLGLIGEGKYNEAVVPLPDGKSIPVTMKSKSGSNVNITVNVDGSRMSNPQDAQRMGRLVGQQIEETVRRVMIKESRVGGMMYSPQY